MTVDKKPHLVENYNMVQNKEKSSIFEKFLPILLVSVVVLAFAVGMLWQKVNILESGKANDETTTTGNEADTPSGPVDGKLSDEQIKNIPSVSKNDHIRGSKDAKVYLIEYSDLECPFCKRFHETAKQIIEEYDGRVAWIYRHFPLDSLHPKARTEALAVECALDQGGADAFWKMTDKIYEVTPANNGLDLATLPNLANQIGLNGTKLQKCIDDQTFKDLVEEEYQGGIKAGVTGTPGNFIVLADGSAAWAIPGAMPFESMKTAIDQALEAVK